MSVTTSPVIFSDREKTSLRSAFAQFLTAPNYGPFQKRLEAELKKLLKFCKVSSGKKFAKDYAPIFQDELLNILNLDLLFTTAKVSDALNKIGLDMKSKLPDSIPYEPGQKRSAAHLTPLTSFLAHLSSDESVVWNNLRYLITEVKRKTPEDILTIEKNISDLRDHIPYTSAEKATSIRSFLRETRQARKDYFIAAVKSEVTPESKHTFSTTMSAAVSRHENVLNKNRTAQFFRGITQALHSIVAFFSKATGSAYQELAEAKAQGISSSSFFVRKIQAGVVRPADVTPAAVSPAAA